MREAPDNRPLVAHVMYRFDVGGLENGIVNLINHMPRDAYRHVVIALTEVTDFRHRIQRDDVEFIALGKPPGHAVWIYPQLYTLFRELRPAIVHSRNLAALEVVVPAWAAGIRVRIHSEHGREGADLSDTNCKYRLIRKIYRPFVTYYLALSRDLENYLKRFIGISGDRMIQIYNGVDAQKFAPANGRTAVSGSPFNAPELWVIGTVGRFHAVKDQATLVRAFALARSSSPALGDQMRLMLIGDGPLRDEIHALVNELGVAGSTWMPGARQDIPALLHAMDCFVLPSISEGISNTILEAMATGLPVVATDVGGNGELIDAGVTGKLVPTGDVEAMARSILEYAGNREQAKRAGQAGRAAVEDRFSLVAMVRQYQGMYDRLLGTIQR